MNVSHYLKLIWSMYEEGGDEHNPLDIYPELSAFTSCWAEMIPTNNPPETVDLIRVQVNCDGKFDIVDFTTARRSGRLLYQNVPQEGIPTWMIEAISMLRITDARSVVQNVGFKVNDKLYYIVDKRGENEQSQVQAG